MIIYALKRAADELQAEIERFGVVVKLEQNTIMWGDQAVQVNHGTSRINCKRIIRQFVKQARAQEHERFMSKQTSLLGEV